MNKFELNDQYYWKFDKHLVWLFCDFYCKKMIDL